MKNISFSPPDITTNEKNRISEVLNSGWITTGPTVKRFESRLAKYCGTQNTVCLNSATAGLELILRVLGISDGDEVITSAYTYTASASIIAHTGAKIVLADTKNNSYEMDYDKLSSLITPKTKAIIAVDIAGVICDYNKLFNIVNYKKSCFVANNPYQEAIGRICVIADAAHSFGATQDDKISGSIADFSVFSFHAVKNLTTAEGGAITWNKALPFDTEALYKEFMLLALHGQDKDALTKSQAGAWEYDIKCLGYKYNMTDIAAGIGIAQLSRYPYFLAERHTIIKQYNNAFAGTNIEFLAHVGENYRSSGHLYLTRITNIKEEKRNKFIQKMAEDGIATNVHYKPLPLFTAYKNLGFDIKDFPNAFNQYQNQISLPLHTKLSADDITYIIENYIKAVKEV
ncbi:MAG: DegT/DnrJ/EryC1/StrS family aminotransferase [Firmicutes bacterium]|nr:DegT/DnrJ/EryC1/StrS family aminotransferase [Bacillota bacterium]